MRHASVAKARVLAETAMAFFGWREIAALQSTGWKLASARNTGCWLRGLATVKAWLRAVRNLASSGVLGRNTAPETVYKPLKKTLLWQSLSFSVIAKEASSGSCAHNENTALAKIPKPVAKRNTTSWNIEEAYYMQWHATNWRENSMSTKLKATYCQKTHQKAKYSLFYEAWRNGYTMLYSEGHDTTMKINILSNQICLICTFCFCEEREEEDIREASKSELAWLSPDLQCWLLTDKSVMTQRSREKYISLAVARRSENTVSFLQLASGATHISCSKRHAAARQAAALPYQSA